MNRLLTRNIATMTELRDPQKVLDAAKGEPVAILKNSKLVAYLVPAERVEAEPGHRYATLEEVGRAMEERREVNQPVLDWLRDK
jgi:antitoxin StbD